jgi:hypothetical protein
MLVVFHNLAPKVPPMKILDGAPRIKMWGISELMDTSTN